MKLFLAIMYRECLLAFRQSAGLFNPLIFYLILVALFPLAISPEKQLLQTIAPGIIWIGALLAALLSLDRLFRTDFSDGSLEQFCLTHGSLSVIIMAKILAHWLLTGLPMLLIAPLLSILLSLPSHQMGALLISLLLGTPLFSLLGAIVAALTVGLRGSGALLALIILPLLIPILILGTGCVVMTANHLAPQAFYALLGALLLIALPLAPWLTAEAVRVRLS